MKFSVVIPVYNVEGYLVECLESVLSQTFNNLEVICVNDASTDSSLNILKEYEKKDSRIRIVNNETNGGLSYSRNRGVEKAEGDYIFFLDSDDYIKPQTLSVCATILKEKPVDILNFNYELLLESDVVNENNMQSCSQYESEKVIKTGQEWFRCSMKNNSLVIAAWSRVYSTAYLKENNLLFYEKLLYEDQLFCFQVALTAKKVLTISDNLYVYRKRGSSITTTKSEKHIDSLAVIISRLIFYWNSVNLDDEMNQVVQLYIDKNVEKLYQFLKYFPEHNKLHIGNSVDQYLFNLIKSKEQIYSRKYINLNSEELKRIESFEKRIVFGAGAVAIELLEFLIERKLEIYSVAVTNKANNTSQLLKYDIRQIDELVDDREDALVIIAVKNNKREPMYDLLKKLGFFNILRLDIN